MLPKKERLSRLEFNRFFSVGKRQHSPLFQIVFAPHETLHASVVVSKKIAKRAVVRNKIRRRIYDIVRNYHSEERMCGVFIFVVKPGVVTTPYAALKSEVITALQTIVKKFN
ncbi:MAG: ribonuclease P protein component [Minisyncoccia bacterium]